MNSDTQQINLTTLTSHLTVFLNMLEEFTLVLDKEAEAIRSNKPDSIIEASQAKQDVAEKLNRAGTSLEAVITPHSDNLVDLSVSTTFEAFPTELKTQIKNAIDQTIQCHDKNLANGMSIQILSNLNGQALDILSGKANQEVTLYGASGEQNQSKDKNTLGTA